MEESRGRGGGGREKKGEVEERRGRGKEVRGATREFLRGGDTNFG